MMSIELQLVVFTVLLSPLMVRSFLVKDGDFEYFTFAQSWPPGVCAAGKREHHTCSVKGSVSTWTVHGLWPSVWTGKEPFFCNDSAKFDFSKLAGIQGDLNTYWPNVYSDTEYDSFWEHEWDKHGTCAMSMDATKSEYLFFKKGLALNTMYNISKILEAANIVPKPGVQYTSKQFIDAIQSVIHQEPVLGCAYTKLSNGTGYHLIEQVEICLDKSFQPISCYHPQTGQLGKNGHVHEPYSNCPKYPYNYPPIIHM